MIEAERKVNQIWCFSKGTLKWKKKINKNLYNLVPLSYKHTPICNAKWILCGWDCILFDGERSIATFVSLLNASYCHQYFLAYTQRFCNWCGFFSHYESNLSVIFYWIFICCNKLVDQMHVKLSERQNSKCACESFNYLFSHKIHRRIVRLWFLYCSSWKFNQDN